MISAVLNSIHWCPSDALSYPGRARRTNKLCVLVSTCWGTRELFPWCSMNILSILYYGEIIQTKKDKQTLCPRLKLLRNTRTCTFFSVAVWTNQEKKLCVLVSRCWKWAFCSCSWKGWFYAVFRFSCSTCCIRTLHIWTNSVLSCKKKTLKRSSWQWTFYHTFHGEGPTSKFSVFWDFGVQLVVLVRQNVQSLARLFGVRFCKLHAK